MMGILERYIIRNVTSSILIVLIVLMAIFAFFGFLAEMNKVGEGEYTVMKAVSYTVLALPNLMYQLLPVTALIGTTLGLGLMAGNSELVAIRSAGVSLNRIIWSVTRIGIVIAVVTVALGEWVAPKTERIAQTLRSVAISKQITIKGKQGLWAKDGDNIVNIRKFLPGERFGDVYIYRLNSRLEVVEFLHADSASLKNDRWVLEGITSSVITTEQVSVSSESERYWDTGLSPDLINVVTMKPTTLSAWGLYQYINYLKANGLSSELYEQALWTKFTLPLVSIVMVLLAIPFVFGSLRSVAIGHRILVGVLLGVGFHLFNKAFTFLGLVFHLNPFFSAIFPTALALIAAVYFIRRVH